MHPHTKPFIRPPEVRQRSGSNGGAEVAAVNVSFIDRSVSEQASKPPNHIVVEMLVVDHIRISLAILFCHSLLSRLAVPNVHLSVVFIYSDGERRE